MDSQKNQPPVGEATGEFIAENDCEQPQQETVAGAPGAGEFTGEFLPPATEERVRATAAGGYRTDVPGDATGEFQAEREGATGAPVGEATGDFIAQREAPQGATGAPVGEATGDFLPSEPEASVPQKTGMRSQARLTAAGSAGAFPAPEPSRHTGRYFLKKFHAKGGMGEIWLAQDGDIGRAVALKRMLKGREDQRAQFLQEAQVTGQLEHPGVVPVHELGADENGQPFYVMKFVHGRTLQEVIKEFHAPEAAAGAEPKAVQQSRLLNIFLDLCQTVAYAHSRGVIHRDLKPDNVMVGPYGETLVLDWGLAKVVGKAEETKDPLGPIQLSHYDDTMATLDGSVKGTPAYFAPEVADGRVDEVDQLSDVYLLGGVLYMILTGRPPRQANKIKELLALAKNTPPVPPRELKADVPKPLNAICVKALAHKKKDRYQSAAALAEDIQCYLAGEPASAYRENWAERAWRWIKRHRKLIGRAAAGLVILAVALTAFLLVREANLRSEEALRVAAKLQKEDEARQAIGNFRNLAEEARFYAAMANPMTENSPFLDLAKAQAKGKEALAVAAAWGPGLGELALEEPRPQLKTELYDLSVEQAQVLALKPDKDSAREALGLLEQAANLREPTRSFYRLRGQLLKVLDEGDKGAADVRRAGEADVATTVLDHYLRGEELRRESLLAGTNTDPKQGREARKILAERAEILDQAIAEYRKAVAINPDHYWSHFQIGKCDMALDRPAEAVEALGTCVALRPQAPWSYATRAFALTQLKRYKDAENDIATALSKDPDFLPARLNRGVISLQQKKYEAALEDFDYLLALPPEKRLVEAAFSRGQLYMQRDQYDKALADFNLLIENNVANRNVYLERTRIFLVQGKLEQCLQSLTVYLTNGRGGAAKDPKLLEQQARELRVLATNELPLDARALRAEVFELIRHQLNQAIQNGAKAPAIYVELGEVLEKLAGLAPRQEAGALLKEAIETYSTGLKIDPQHVRLRILRGWAYVNLNENTKARDDFAVAAAADPKERFDKDHAEAQTGLGFAQACLDGSPEALQSANRALLHAGGDYVILHNVACVYAALSDKDATHARDYQDMTIDLLKRALQLWKEGDKTGPDEILLIRGESAFSAPLRKRPEFRNLLESK